jgi:uncharacterized membrane protein (DUF485 family)
MKGESVHKSAHDMLESADFKNLVRKRWTLSIVLTIALFVMYYGYILLIALDKPYMATKIGETTTLGIPVGVAVIVVSWVLTAIYVVWANNVYDKEVQKLRDKVQS